MSTTLSPNNVRRRRLPKVLRVAAAIALGLAGLSALSKHSSGDDNNGTTSTPFLSIIRQMTSADSDTTANPDTELTLTPSELQYLQNLDPCQHDFWNAESLPRYRAHLATLSTWIVSHGGVGSNYLVNFLHGQTINSKGMDKNELGMADYFSIFPNYNALCHLGNKGLVELLLFGRDALPYRKVEVESYNPHGSWRDGTILEEMTEGADGADGTEGKEGKRGSHGVTVSSRATKLRKPPIILVIGDVWKSLVSQGGRRQSDDTFNKGILAGNIAKDRYGSMWCSKSFDECIDQHPSDPVGIKDMVRTYTHLALAHPDDMDVIFLKAPYTKDSVMQALQMAGIDADMDLFDERDRSTYVSSKYEVDTIPELRGMYEPYVEFMEMWERLPEVWEGGKPPVELMEYLERDGKRGTEGGVGDAVVVEA